MKMRYFSLFILAFLLFTLVGCNSFKSVKSNMEDAGYTYNEKAGEQIKELLNEFEENDIKVTPHFFSKGLNFPIVLEFESIKELNEQIEESETLKGFIKDLKKSDYVRGNCLLIPIGINQSEMVNAFQGIKDSKK